MAAAGGVVNAGGAIFSAIGASQQDNYQAAVAQNNAMIAHDAMKNDIQAGAADQQSALFKSAGLIGAAKAAQGSSGLDVNSGSAVQVRTTDDMFGQLGAMTIRSNAARAAYGSQVQSEAFTAEAGLDKDAAANALVSGAINATSSLLAAGSSAYNTGMLQSLQASGSPPAAGSPTIGP
jgi:hypothetical protein